MQWEGNSWLRILVVSLALGDADVNAGERTVARLDG